MRDTEHITETIDRMKPAWLNFVDVPRKRDNAHNATENIAHIIDKQHKPSIGIFIICESDILRNLSAISSAIPEAVMATSDWAMVNHIDISAKINPGTPKVRAKMIRLLETAGFASCVTCSVVISSPLSEFL